MPSSRTHAPLLPYFNDHEGIADIGVDEAGRGPLFGRVYASAVILPKETIGAFDHTLMKDSKKFASKKKILDAAEYIKANASAWAVTYEDEKTIDKINILQATQQAMHRAIKECIDMHTQRSRKDSEFHLLVDGNYFKSYMQYDKHTGTITSVPHTCVKGGDNTYSSIAAASILAKVSRDTYIESLCDEHEYLDAIYGIRGNKGYGAKKHMDAVREHGITMWHRLSFAPCKNNVFIDAAKTKKNEMECKHPTSAANT